MNRTSFTIIVLALMCTWEAAEAQDHRHHSITLAGGMSYLAHQDIIHTPFVHGGMSPISFEITYRREGARWVHFATGRYSAHASQVGDSFEIDHGDHGHNSLPHGFLFLDAGYGIGRTVTQGRLHRASAGLSVRADIQAAFYRFGAEENFGYFINPGLNLWYSRSNRLSPRSALRAHVEIPVVSWLARSPYLVNDDDFIENISSNDRLKTVFAFLADGSLVTWDRLQRFDAGVDYTLSLARQVSVGASYRFAFTRSTEPRALIAYRSSLHLSTTFNL